MHRGLKKDLRVKHRKHNATNNGLFIYSLIKYRISNIVKGAVSKIIKLTI